jgi:hypothetical protein
MQYGCICVDLVLSCRPSRGDRESTRCIEYVVVGTEVSEGEMEGEGDVKLRYDP